MNGIVTDGREPEDEQQHEQRDRDRDRLALLQVLVEDRVELVLDRRGARDVGALDTGRLPDRARAGRRSTPFASDERERRDDVAVDDVRAGDDAASSACRVGTAVAARSTTR